jgi:cytochrome c
MAAPDTKSMDLFEFNKIAGAVLSALLLAFGSRAVYDIVAREEKPPKPGYSLPVTEPTETAAAGTAAAPFEFAKVAELLPKASAENGKDVFKRCMACHTADKGGPNRVGPNLWGVVGRHVGAHPGFAYSEAMKSKGGEWTWEALAAYIHDPRGTVPGNKMAFAGIKDNAELADLLAYLRTLSDSPPPLPG